ncbi:ATP-binding cassette domain-containing protein [Streptomyces venezuelae]|uniref:ABC transporter n=1 Tax=Streptomyces venezuelae TaxID=54571 RepID=A0A5P2BLB2_STRVZ|nr:ATP-binding cassette domain-containing protein [Streptomyces venezuelae]QES29911.1 ABC transporter [Streptomyces venezuelae]
MIQAIGLTSNPRQELPPAVEDVSFEAHSGRVTALLDAEPIGTTTALRLMLELQQGRGITYFRGRPLHRIAHPSREVGVLMGDVPGHPARSVRGHLRMLCAAVGVPVLRADDVLEAVGLVSLHNERLGALSRGMDRRLGLACALLADPHTLVLDRPGEGLSARESAWLHGILRAHASQGGTVLFTTDDPKEAARTADRVVTLDSGQLAADQEAADFARTRLRPRVAVRTPHAARLGALLTKEARTNHRTIEVVTEDGNRLSVYGSTCAAVGETAYRHGILVHQLADEIGDAGPQGRTSPTRPTHPAPLGSPTRRTHPSSRTLPQGSPARPDHQAAQDCRGTQDPQGTQDRPDRQGAQDRPGRQGGKDQPDRQDARDSLNRQGTQDRTDRQDVAPLDSVPLDTVPLDAVPLDAETDTPTPRPRPSTEPLTVALKGTASTPASAPASGSAPESVPARTSAPAPTSVSAQASAPAPASVSAAATALPPPITVRPGRSPLRPLRYEIRRLLGVGTGYFTLVAVLATSALFSVFLARSGHTPQPHLLAAWPHELPLPPAALGAGLLGALAFGDEFRHPALAADRGTVPRRLGMLGAKLLVAAATALLLSTLAVISDAVLLHLVYGEELTKVPADWPSLTASWYALVTGCAWAGVLAAGVFRSTTAGLAAVLAVPIVVVPLVQKAVEGPAVRSAAGLPARLRDLALVQWPFGAERYLAAGVRMIAQPVGTALMLSLTALLCAYLLTAMRTRVR